MGKSIRSILAITWLALLISVVVTGDRIVDLVFEQPIAATSDNAPETEEPDNAAEHVLMPSQKGEGPLEVSLLAGLTADFDVSFMAPSPRESAAARRVDSYDESTTRSSPASFVLPLRI